MLRSVTTSISILFACVASAASAAPLESWRYDFGDSTWRALPTVGAPEVGKSGFESSLKVFSGGRLGVWGSFTTEDSQLRAAGAIYDSTQSTWIPMGTDGAPSPRRGAQTISRLSKVLVWGGTDERSVRLSSGSVFDISTNRWTATPEDAPTLRFAHSVVMDDKALLVGQAANDDAATSGAIYSFAENRWAKIPPTNLIVSRHVIYSGRAGSRAMFWGPTSPYGCVSAGAYYSLESGMWESVATAVAPPGCRFPTVYGIDGGILVWGGEAAAVRGNEPMFAPTSSGGVYLERDKRWTPMSADGAPLIPLDESGRYRSFFDRGALVLLKIESSGSDSHCSGYRYVVREDRWSKFDFVSKLSSELRSADISRRRLWAGTFPKDPADTYVFETGDDGVKGCALLAAPAPTASALAWSVLWTGSDLFAFRADHVAEGSHE